MTSAPATYWPGSWVAVTSPRAWLLLDSTVEDGRLQAIWQAMNSDNPTDATLEVLLSSGLNSLPAFALVDSTAQGLRIVVRHPAEVRLHSGSETREITGNSTGTWVDQTTSQEWDRLELLAAASTGGAELPLALGITSASGLVVSRDSREPMAQSSDESPSTPRVPEQTTLDDHPSLENEMVPAPEVAAPVNDEGLDEALAESDAIPEPDTYPASGEIPDAPAPAETESSNSANRYEQLLGATTDRDALIASLNDMEQSTAADADPSVEELNEADSDDSADHGHTIGWTAPDDEPADIPDEQPISPPAAPPSTGSGSGLIDGIPGISFTSSDETPAVSDPAPAIGPGSTFSAPIPTTPAPPVPTPAAADISTPASTGAESDEAQVQTVNRAALLKAMQNNTADGPKVLAVTCPTGHLTSAYEHLCRVCGVAVTDQNAIEIPRPPLGFLRLSTGQSVVLDRDIILGRAPIDMTADPALKPNLVQLTESDEVSRMHVRITLDGWQPMIRDLDSANGTTLKLRDGEATALRPLQDYPLEAGCEVSLAEIVTFTYEVKA